MACAFRKLFNFGFSLALGKTGLVTGPSYFGARRIAILALSSESPGYRWSWSINKCCTRRFLDVVFAYSLLICCHIFPWQEGMIHAFPSTASAICGPAINHHDIRLIHWGVVRAKDMTDLMRQSEQARKAELSIRVEYSGPSTQHFTRTTETS